MSNITKGDKLVVTKGLRGWLDEGEIVTVTNVDDNGIIYFAFGENLDHKGIMNLAEYERCFEKIEKVEELNFTPSITWDDVEEIIGNSELKFDTVADKCTIATCKLPNGFVIVESYTCANTEDYVEEVGIEACICKIEDKVMELENYRLQEELYRESNETLDCHCKCCDGNDKWIDF